MFPKYCISIEGSTAKFMHSQYLRLFLLAVIPWNSNVNLNRVSPKFDQYLAMQSSSMLFSYEMKKVVEML